MLTKYLGNYIEDSGLQGYKKSDGVVPGVTSVIQLSRDRFCAFYVPHMMGAWDMNTAILYQIRADSPVGPVIREGVAMAEDSDWRPFAIPLYRCPGLTFAWGVPKGALAPDGSLLTNENVFVIHTYINPHLSWDGQPMNAIGKTQGKYPNWPDHVTVEDLTGRLPRVFNRHFRLNDRGDDLDFLTDWEIVHQVGYGSGLGEPFCSFDRRFTTMHNGFTPPLPANAYADTWFDVAAFQLHPSVLEGPARTSMAVISYKWNPASERYDWVTTGQALGPPERTLSEGGLVHIGDQWLITARGRGATDTAISFHDTGTTWVKTSDPLQPAGDHMSELEGDVPRMAYLFGDGRLRIVFPEEKWVALEPGEPIPLVAYYPNRGKYARDPLVMYDVDPETLEYSSRQIVFNAAKLDLPVKTPGSDHVTLTPAVGKKQWLLFRMKDRDALKCGTDEKSLAATGVHCIELTYEDEVDPAWRF
jgi:hypothetical protein